ncbi:MULTISPECIES: lysylphosphatidylglycerol synthase transmembrane domain-containing protein [unclassified Pseudodesulfovibrio]|uniref:lysylphosphatidylglycerol synthase transmembrane domain-containing protein n=1 Tax=unclassified Pseudodesulfovibrio TaxID=2661612 RepID=UPI000FEB9B71|nr:MULTISPECIES: lysylphosphatidylglycerol synthase transmembrane domain-containing protein [unclassified Pseudodesulfovibrio]MCJ2164127.1 flippase-like domain-containing protein [Pseudodesulfovibrio sp. S3-i]RWU05244.1 UPF0104 family protein [Pseudodesulfovibrio sp. S3]
MKTKILFTILQLLILAACVVYLFTDVDWQELAETFSHCSFPRMIIVLGSTFPIYGLMGLRLNQLSRGKLGTGLSMLGTLLAIAINNILPAKLGEIAKAVYFKRKSPLGFSQSMGIIFLERFLDINVLAVTALATAVVFGLGLYGLPLIAVVLLCWGLLIYMVQRMPEYGLELRFIPNDTLRESVRKTSLAIHQAMQGRAMLPPLGSTVLLWACNFIYLGLIPLWLMELDLTAAQVLGVYGAVYLGLSIPGLPGGIGMTEGAMVAILTWSGLPKTDALAIALTVRAFNFIPPTLMGLIVFATSGMKANVLTKPTE